MISIFRKNQIFYFNAQDPCATVEFGNVFRGLLNRYASPCRDLIFLCIGTDRATGDCLGPILGEKLEAMALPFPVYGTLCHPIHAQNLEDTIKDIHSQYNNPFIVAVDASLGTKSHVGYITLGAGSLNPGAGVAKQLPQVGQLFITGIVNQMGHAEQLLLQTTRLHLVMHLAELISSGIYYALTSQENYCEIQP